MRQIFFFTALLAFTAGTAEFPTAPYADPAQLDCPWPNIENSVTTPSPTPS